jgi:metal-responsive CopG/Arc/MetJ family transcriptional regulator
MFENNCVTASDARMGRPSLGVKYTAIRLSPDVLAKIDALAGVGKRSEFIREAVERELERRGKGSPNTGGS